MQTYCFFYTMYASSVNPYGVCTHRQFEEPISYLLTNSGCHITHIPLSLPFSFSALPWSSMVDCNVLYRYFSLQIFEHCLETIKVKSVGKYAPGALRPLPCSHSKYTEGHCRPYVCLTSSVTEVL